MSRRTKHRMAHFTHGRLSGWNYRGYCVVEKPKGAAGPRWQEFNEWGEVAGYYRALAAFRRKVDRIERWLGQETKP